MATLHTKLGTGNGTGTTDGDANDGDDDADFAPPPPGVAPPSGKPPAKGRGGGWFVVTPYRAAHLFVVQTFCAKSLIAYLNFAHRSLKLLLKRVNLAI